VTIDRDRRDFRASELQLELTGRMQKIEQHRRRKLWLTFNASFRLPRNAVKYLCSVRLSSFDCKPAGFRLRLTVIKRSKYIGDFRSTSRCRRYDGDVKQLEDSTNDAADVGRIVRPVVG